MNPVGVIDLDSELGWTNASADGVRKRFGWSEIETTQGVYDWSEIDAAIASAQSKGKQVGVSVAMCANEDGGPSAIPAWVIASGVKTWLLPTTGSGNTRNVILPWDPMVLPKLISFMAALCKRVDGKVNYVAMGGLGVVIESYITPDPVKTLGMTLDDAVAKWTSSCDTIVETHAANLASTAFIFTAASPFTGQSAKTALDTLVRAKAAKYPNRFGVMDCSLMATSNTGYLPNQLVHDLSATNPVGLQFLTSSAGFGGHDLGGTLAQCMEAGLALNAKYIEVYPLDLNNPSNAAMFKDYSNRLKGGTLPLPQPPVLSGP